MQSPTAEKESLERIRKRFLAMQPEVGFAVSLWSVGGTATLYQDSGAVGVGWGVGIVHVTARHIQWVTLHSRFVCSGLE